jgi:glycosyltransferase involved in cell wall biosynthesis
MRVLIVNNMAPFVWGGAEELAVHLTRALVEAGHDAEVVRIPFRWDPAAGIPAQMLLVRGLELTNVDRVIALKFPAYLIRHPDKTIWLLHQYRQAYDLIESGHSNIPEGEDGDEIRRIIKGADDETFRESRRIFANSEVTCDRLARNNGFRAEVLRPPLNDAELFTGGPADGYVFAGGRVNAMKRQHLLVEALAAAPNAPRLVIGGPPDMREDGDRLRRMVEGLGLADRVVLDLRYMPRGELAAYVNGASAVACLPLDEDSLSYVAMEAAAAGKPVLATTDSGGVLGLARDLETGWVVAPDAASLAGALERIATDAPKAAELGAAARELWTGMALTWPQTVERLLA